MTHKHHIIPKHMTHGVANNHPDNLIELTVEEHAEAHKQLWLMYGCWEDELAWKSLSGLISTEEAHRLAASLGTKGKRRSKEHADKIRIALKGRVGHKQSKETRLKISKANTGKYRTASHRLNLSLALKGKKRSFSKRPNALGKKQSKETIEKRRLKQFGRIQSLETRAKISATKRNRLCTV